MGHHSVDKHELPNWFVKGGPGSGHYDHHSKRAWAAGKKVHTSFHAGTAHFDSEKAHAQSLVAASHHLAAAAHAPTSALKKVHLAEARYHKEGAQLYARESKKGRRAKKGY